MFDDYSKLNSAYNNQESIIDRLQFYADLNQLYQTIAKHVESGLASKQAILVIALPKMIEAMREIFSVKKINITVAEKHGSLVIYDAEEMLSKIMSDGMPHAINFKSLMDKIVQQLVARGHKLRIYDAMRKILITHGKMQASLSLENLWHALANEYGFTFLHQQGLVDKNSDPDTMMPPRDNIHHLPNLYAEKHHHFTVQKRKLGVVQDISHAQFEKSLKQLVKGKKTQVLSVLSHELRTPLASIILQAQVVSRLLTKNAKDANVENTDKYIEELNRNIKNLNAIIDYLFEQKQA